MQHPSLCYWKVVLQVLRYLKGTIDHGFLFRSSPVFSYEVTLVSFVDVDWGSDLVDCKSVFGHHLLINNNCIVWSSKNQYVIS